jgi:aspartate/methionine/tyrosine aminotransferase
MKILPLAKELNDVIEREAPPAFELLSGLGRRLYFPKGIISQSAEAKKHAHRFNATIGMATERRGPMHLGSLGKLFAMEPQDVFFYAPTAGRPELRSAWQEKVLRENPGLRGKATGLPIVTSALTHGLSLAAELFIDPGDVIVLPDQFWGNYRLTFEVKHQGQIETFPLFDGQRFNVRGLREKLDSLASSRKKAVLLLNFPNNPTGFTPHAADAEPLRDAVVSAAQKGLKQLVIVDDAYFGLFYDEDCLQESIFSHLAGCHPNVLAVKLDGATKEAFAWGLRVGFLTFAAAGSGNLAAVHEALEKKTMGAIRGGISNSPQVSQSAVLRALRDPAFDAERRRKRDLLCERALRTHEVLRRPEFQEAWTPYPFNSGYFMCVKLHGVDAEALRLHVLHKHGTGVIASGGTDIRVAFSCLELDEIQVVFETLHQAWKELRSGARSS